MRSELSITLAALSDSELVTEVRRLAGCERESMASLVAHLAELDSRRLHLEAGFPSLFVYCRLCCPQHKRGYVAGIVMLRTSPPTAPMAAAALANTT